MWGGTWIRKISHRRSTHKTPGKAVDKQNRFRRLRLRAGLLSRIFRIVLGAKTTTTIPSYTRVLYIVCHESNGGVHKTRLKEPENERATCAQDGGVPVWIPRVCAVRARVSYTITVGAEKNERERDWERKEKMRQQAWQTSLYYCFTTRLTRILFYLLCTHIHFCFRKKRNNCFIVFELVKANLTDYYYSACSVSQSIFGK